jgi:hypothetical protein
VVLRRGSARDRLNLGAAGRHGQADEPWAWGSLCSRDRGVPRPTRLPWPVAHSAGGSRDAAPRDREPCGQSFAMALVRPRRRVGDRRRRIWIGARVVVRGDQEQGMTIRRDVRARALEDGRRRAASSRRGPGRALTS